MPSTALADPGFSSQVAELRHDRRPNSAKQQTSRRAFHRAPGLMPPIVEPSPQYIAISAASQIVTSVQPTVLENFLSGMGGALVTPSSLRLLNGFLDYLLWTVLMKAQSSKLSRVRAAVQSTLEEKAAKKAIAAAEDELNEYIGGGGMSVLTDADNNENTNTKSEEERIWDIQQIWKKIRLRCMVYTRLGDMEEEDEKEHLNREGLDAPHVVTNPDDSLFVSPATAIFLTSIIEFVAENSLIAGGSTASARMESKKAMKDQADDDFEDSGFETKTPPPPERLIVQDEDMEHLAYDCVIGQLWHTWKRALRGSLSLMTYPGLRSTRPRVAHRQADDSRVYERSFMSNMDLSHVHDAPGPISHSEPDLPQTECVRDPTCKDIVRSRSKTLQDQKTPDAQRETDEAMERISQHYRSQSMTTSPAAKRRAMLLSSQARVKRPSPDDVDPVYVPSALDTVDIDRHLEEQSRSNKDRSASPDLSYYFEASANRRADRGEVNEEPMLTSCFTMQDPQESQEKQHTLPWLIPPEYKEGDKSSTSDCMSIKTRPPATAFSTTYSLHRANSRADSASGKILPSITSGFSSTKRPFTEESNQSPVSSMFRHLIPRNITSEGSDKSRVEVQSISSAPGLDDLLSRDGTIRMTYQSGRMRDIESRRTVERSRLPASAAREPSVRSDNSTRLLSEFIRSTGPEQLPEPRGASPRNRKGPQFQARDAGYDKEEDLHELAEFIRRGPPESHKKYGHKTVPMSIRVPQNYGTAPLEPYLSSSAGDSQASSMATPHSETDDTSAPSTPEKLAVDPFNDADLNNITLSEFLRTMPVPSEAQCGPSLLPAARRFQGFDGKPPSVRTMSTIQNRSCTTRSIKTVSMKPSVASLGRKSTFSSPSAPSSEYISMKDADTALRKTKQMLRKHKKTSADPYRDSPYGERDTPYGASLERERRTRKFANILRSRTDSTSPPIPSALSDGGPSGESRLSARDRSMSAADSSKHSMMSGSYGGNTSSVKVMISGPDDAMKARYKGSGGHVNDSFSSAGSRKQPRTITKLFKKAR